MQSQSERLRERIRRRCLIKVLSRESGSPETWTLRLGFWTPAFAGEQCTLGCAPPNPRTPARRRSEEHTSELQSLMRISYAVFCLTKKNTSIQNHYKPDKHNYYYPYNPE